MYGRWVSVELQSDVIVNVYVFGDPSESDELFRARAIAKLMAVTDEMRA